MILPWESEIKATHNHWIISPKWVEIDPTPNRFPSFGASKYDPLAVFVAVLMQ
jgi:hypothetical protein